MSPVSDKILGSIHPYIRVNVTSRLHILKFSVHTKHIPIKNMEGLVNLKTGVRLEGSSIVCSDWE